MMRYIITERQLRLINEQPTDDYSQGQGGVFGAQGKEIFNEPIKWGNEETHKLLDFLSIMSIAIPGVGLGVSAGLSLADAALYWNEGDKKTATMVAIFPFLPFGKIGELIPSAKRLGKEGMENLAKKLGKGNVALNKVEQEVAQGISKNKDVFTQEVKRVSDDLAKKAQNLKAKATQGILRLAPNPDWIYRWFSNNTGGMIKNLFEKINKLDKIPFNPKNVKIVNNGVLDSVEKGVFKQRPIIEIQVKETGDRFLVYSSTGTGAPTLKQAGDWQLLAGFQPMLNNPKDIRWYLKDEATTQLTKGLNQWATELANFIKKNGPDALGK